MPTYMYECEDCGEQVEELKPMSKMAECPDCPECGGDTKRILGPTPGVVN